MCVPPGYIAAVLRAGGVPLILPITSDPLPVAALCAGFLLTGSQADVSPELYGRRPPKGSYSDPERDQVDFALLRHAEETRKPVFGICRGCQVMNVYRQGTLALHYRDLTETPITHQGSDSGEPNTHRVLFQEGAWMTEAVGGGTRVVNSLHRQVCDRLGRNLRVAALSEDGLIEAIEDTAAPERFFAVQWHPEYPAQGPDALSVALFARFIQAATQ